MARPPESRLSQIFRAVSHLRGRSFGSFFGDLVHSIDSDDIFGRSAQLAYYFFFALFPGFVFLSALMGSLSGTRLRENLMVHLPRLVPPQAFDLIQKIFSETSHVTDKLTFGAIVALWSATVGMAAACDTLNAVHDVKESRPYWKVRFVALVLTVITALLLLFAIVALFTGDAIIRFSGYGQQWLLMALIKAAQWIVAFALVAVIFAIIYYFAPDVTERRWHWITPGAALGILLWIVATVALRIYLYFFHSFSVTYGSLGAVIILLTWFYIGGFAMLTGAEINAVIENEAAQQGNPEATAKGEKSPKAA
jgi:membrane protein